MRRRRWDNPRSEATGKRGRSVIAAVLAAGGTVTITTKGHLRVVGPGGVAFVGVHGGSGRAQRNAMSTIRVYSGLAV